MFKIFKRKLDKTIQFHSEFGGLWIDRIDKNFNFVDEVRNRKLYDQMANLSHFRDYGFVILNNAVDPKLIENIKADMASYSDNPEKFVVRNLGKYIPANNLRSLDPKDRIIDLYSVSKAAREAIFSPKIQQFLKAIFDEPALAMQSLTFEYGSQQAIHQDTAYVVSTDPMKLVASWIALEDVREGSGELIYYPGSHRFPDYKFGGNSKSWIRSKHGNDTHQKFLKQLHQLAGERNIKTESFLAKKGDVLIWHADLAHGGQKISDPNMTRSSLVTHYITKSVRPNYFNFDDVKNNYHELEHNGNYFTSRHYNLSDLENDGAATIYYGSGPEQIEE